jgi:FkbM family methyltransferase
MQPRNLKSRVRLLVGERVYQWLSDAKVTMVHWLRRLIGRDPWMRPAAQVPVERHGEWYLSPTGVGRDSIVYSLGIGRDLTFDRSVIDRFGADVHAFDPTPAAIAWVRGQVLPPQLHVHEYGVADFDGVAEFAFPVDPENASFSYRGHSAGEASAVRADVRRLGTLMRLLGHSRIDLLKMDIEGAEYEVIEDMLEQRILVKQLLVEFHHRKPWIGPAKTATALDSLRRHGYVLFHVSPSGQECSFLLECFKDRAGYPCRRSTSSR